MAQTQDNRDPDAEKIEQEMYNEARKNTYMNDETALDQIRKAKTDQELKRQVGKVVTVGARLIGFKVMIIIIAIVAIIAFLIGIISFFLTMPDMVRGRVIELADDIWSTVWGTVVGKAKTKVNDEDVLNVAKYLENMGYSIKGYGFGEPKRDENGKLTDIDGERNYIFAYLAAENKTYLIANDTWNLSDFVDDVLDGFDDKDLNASWGDGMIVLNEKLVNADSVSIDRKKRLMEVHIQTERNEEDAVDIYQYNLDGWMGRYGKPIEFLLALHTGTMAPDFAYEVAVGDEFDTKVYVKFKKVSTTVRLKYNGLYVTKADGDPDGMQYAKDFVEEQTEETQDWIDSLPPEQQNQDADTLVKQRYGINMEDINDAIKYQEDNTKITYVPYIRAVGDHWFRDLDFKDCYIQTEKEITDKGKYGVFDIEEIKDGMIHQIKEPKIVGDGNAAYSEGEEDDDGFFNFSSDSSDEEESSDDTNATTPSGSNYEGKKMDDLLKDKYKIADGLTGVSDEEYSIDWKMMRYSITMLETVHSEDAQLILRDLKRYLNKRNFVKFTDEYVITDPDKIKQYNDDRNLEYGGQEYHYTGSGSSYKKPPLDNIFKDDVGGVEVSEDRMQIILHHKDAEAQDGFETGADVFSPASGKVVAVDANTIKIQISTSGAEGKTITITGFSVDSSIKTGDRISKGKKMGVTTESDIVITMTDEQGKPISPVGYIPVISASDSEVDELARLMQAEDGSSQEGMIAVGYVVLNRLNDPRYPKTLHDVIWESGQFQPTWNTSSAFYQPATPEALNLARLVLSGQVPDPVAATGKLDGPSLFFLSRKSYKVPDEYINTHPVAYVGNHVFSHSNEYHEEMKKYK